MKFFKNKKIKILCIVLIIIFILYLILFISRIDTSKCIIKDVSKDTILVLIDGKSYWFAVDNALILNENNKKISLSTLKVNDNIFILNYNWRGWVYQAVASIPPEIYNVWLIKVIN